MEIKRTPPLYHFQTLGDKTMSNWIAKVSDAAKSVENVIRSIGPFLISQCDSASEACARHQTRLASVKAGNELLIAEGHALSDAKKELLLRYASSAEPEERFHLKRCIEDISASLRQLKVGVQALNYISPNERNTASAPGSEDASAHAEVTQHWMDKFSELARAHNEPWREDLLARALAAESDQPGSVSTRALWVLGTMEETHFVAFATILDLCSIIEEGIIIPSHNDFNLRPIPDCPLGPDTSLGRLIYLLGDAGLLSDTSSTNMAIDKGKQFIAAYGSSRIRIDCQSQDLIIRGVIPSTIGNSVAFFCDRKPNALGSVDNQASHMTEAHSAINEANRSASLS
jgi:hypothetical protein